VASSTSAQRESGKAARTRSAQSTAKPDSNRFCQMKGWCCPPRIVKALSNAAASSAPSLPSAARR